MAQDVLAVIESQIEALLADEELGTAKRASTAATLCGIALRAIEQATWGLGWRRSSGPWKRGRRSDR
jgi:hypothetical protein